jgi:transcriptional regulator with XRE-family HTH domain
MQIQTVFVGGINMVWGWKKPRSKFGRWLDQQGIEQIEFSKKAKVSRNTISTLCNDKEYIPSPRVMKKILDIIRKTDPGARPDDFFDI